MRLLLDTHVVLWQLEGTRSLGTRTREAIERAGELAFSVVSFAEIGVKAAIGKLDVPADLHDQILRSGVQCGGGGNRGASIRTNTSRSNVRNGISLVFASIWKCYIKAVLGC